MQAIRQINTKNFELAQVQTNLLNVLRMIADKEVVDGVILSNISIGVTDTPIAHMLGRVPLGYIIIGKDGPGDIYTSASSNSLNLTLKSTVAVTAQLWVF